MSKSIIIDIRSTPEQNGYHDRITVLVDDENSYRYHGDCSTCPNPVRPSDETVWFNAYGWVGVPGHYRYSCEKHPTRGKVLRLSDPSNIDHPERLPTVNDNLNHNREPWADGVLVHEGYSLIWRGSAACHTLPPGDEWTKFIALFDIGETGDYIITTKS